MAFRNKLRDFVKYNPVANKIYAISITSVAGVMSFLIHRNPKKIMFVSSGGRKYDCNPYYIYQYMINDQRFEDCEFVWGFVEPQKISIPKGKKVKTNTLSFYKELFSSGVWISNTLIGGGIKLQRRSSYYIHTTHGFPIKKEDQFDWDKPPVNKKRYDIDYICTQGELSASVARRIFDVDPKNVHISGYPRSDNLFHKTDDADLKRIKIKLGLPLDKKILLYMPTYREFIRSKTGQVNFKPPIDINKWKLRLGNDYVIIYRTHYLVADYLKLNCQGFSWDVSSYEPVEELYRIADALISDYSGAFVDYSILNRPMYCFAYDYDEYVEKRGLYIDIKKELPCDVSYTEDELIEYILHSDYKKMCKETKIFRKRFIVDDGHSTKRVCDDIYKVLEEKSQK